MSSPIKYVPCSITCLSILPMRVQYFQKKCMVWYYYCWYEWAHVPLPISGTSQKHTHTLSILTTGSVKNPPKPPDLPGSCHWHHRCWWHWLAAARSTRCWWCWWWHWHLWHWWHLCSILGEPSTSSNRTISTEDERFSNPNNNAWNFIGIRLPRLLEIKRQKTDHHQHHHPHHHQHQYYHFPSTPYAPIPSAKWFWHVWVCKCLNQSEHRNLTGYKWSARASIEIILPIFRSIAHWGTWVGIKRWLAPKN